MGNSGSGEPFVCILGLACSQQFINLAGEPNLRVGKDLDSAGEALLTDGLVHDGHMVPVDNPGSMKPPEATRVS